MRPELTWLWVSGASPLKAAVRLNSGATPTPRRASLGSDEQRRGSGRAPEAGRARRGEAVRAPRRGTSPRKKRAAWRALAPPVRKRPRPRALQGPIEARGRGGLRLAQERLYKELQEAEFGLLRRNLGADHSC